MSTTITIQLSPQAIALSEKFKRAPQEFPQAIKRGMTRALQTVSGRIQQTRLTGPHPFPPSEHRLGERTGQLKLRTQSKPVQITSEGTQTVVEGAIGSSVFYAAFNEFGTRKTPERAPFRTGIRENLSYISGEIEKELMKDLKA